MQLWARVQLFYHRVWTLLPMGEIRTRPFYTNEGKARLTGQIRKESAGQTGLSWTKMNHPALVPGAPAGNWNSGNISQSGQWIRERLKSRKVYDFDPIPEDTLNCRGESRRKFSSKSEGYNRDYIRCRGGENLGYTTPGSWAEYEIFVSRGGTYKLPYGWQQSRRRYCYSEDQWCFSGIRNVGNTGGWQEWTTTSVSSEFSLQSGPAALRVEWSGSGSSLVNLNWIEFQAVTSVVNHAGLG